MCVVFFVFFPRLAHLCRNKQFELKIRPLAVTSLAFLYVGEVFSGSCQQTSWWKRQWAGGSSFLKHSKLQTLPKIPRLCLKSAFSFSDWKIIYFCTLSFKCQFSASLYLTKSCCFYSCLVEHTKLNTQAQCTFFSFVFVFSLNWEIWPKKEGEFGHRCFLPLNFGLMGPVFDLIHWELSNRTTVCSELLLVAYCCHLWQSSQCLFQICHRTFSGFIY